jgi:hypothetical protein
MQKVCLWKQQAMTDYSKVWGFQQTMVQAAVRYCMGRMSHIVSCCVDWIIENWENFDKGTRDCIQRDLEEEFKRDDENRLVKSTGPYPLGMNQDRAQWERVRKLWQSPDDSEIDAAAKKLIEEFVTTDRTIRIDGKLYRCGCGCNVFRCPDPADPDLFQCNSCGSTYKAE